MYKPKDKQAQGRTDWGMNMVTWQRLCVSLRQQNALANALASIDIYNKKI